MTEVSDVAAAGVSGVLGAGSVARLLVEPRLDPDGADALRVIVVLTKTGEAKLDGDAVLDTLFVVARDLADAGDDRLPMIDYTTEEELAIVDDPDS